MLKTVLYIFSFVVFVFVLIAVFMIASSGATDICTTTKPITCQIGPGETAPPTSSTSTTVCDNPYLENCGPSYTTTTEHREWHTTSTTVTPGDIHNAAPKPVSIGTAVAVTASPVFTG